MKQVIGPWGWLALAAVLLTSNSGRASGLPLKELDQETIQSRLRHYLKQPASEVRLASLRALVRLDAEQITYVSRAGRPERLVWAYEPAGTLNPLQRATVECCLEGMLSEVLGRYQGGLLASDDVRAVLAVVRVCDAARPVAVERGRPRGMPAVLASLLSLATTCFCCFDCCGGCSFNCCFSCSFCCDCCWSCCSPCWDCCPSWNCSPCYPSCDWCGYPTWPYYHGAYTVTPGTVYFAYPGYCNAPSQPAAPARNKSKSGSSEESDQADQLTLLEERSVAQAPAPRSLNQVERNFSVVRRRLLLKYNTGPEHALALSQRALRAYEDHEYQEAQDLASVAVQLNDQDPRSWYVKALSERALGDQESALESARHGSALEVLGKRDVLRGMERIARQDRRYLSETLTSLTEEQARQVVAGPALALHRPRVAPGGAGSANLPFFSRLLGYNDIPKESSHAPCNLSRLRRPARSRPAGVQAGSGVVARARHPSGRLVPGRRPRRQPLRQDHETPQGGGHAGRRSAAPRSAQRRGRRRLRQRALPRGAVVHSRQSRRLRLVAGRGAPGRPGGQQFRGRCLWQAALYPRRPRCRTARRTAQSEHCGASATASSAESRPAPASAGAAGSYCAEPPWTCC